VTSAALRGALLLAASFVAFAFKDKLGAAESFLGAICDVQSSLLMPTIFYAVLQHRQRKLTALKASVAAFVVLLGSALIAVILVQATSAVGRGPARHAPQS
jgi:hypothetical protein